MFLIRIGQKIIVPLMVIVCIMLLIMLQFGLIFLVVALLPSIAAYFIDSSDDRSTFRTIFACNLAATLQTMAPMFASGLRFKHFEIGTTISDPKVWLLFYGGAAIGWGIIYFGRSVGRMVLTIKHKLQLSMLQHSQAKLLEEWGYTVRGVVEKKEN